jgi:chromosome segregation ATPase
VTQLQDQISALADAQKHVAESINVDKKALQQQVADLTHELNQLKSGKAASKPLSPRSFWNGPTAQKEQQREQQRDQLRSEFEQLQVHESEKQAEIENLTVNIADIQKHLGEVEGHKHTLEVFKKSLETRNETLEAETAGLDKEVSKMKASEPVAKQTF